MKLISSVVTVATVWASIAQAQGRTDRESLSGGYVFEFENGHVSSLIPLLKKNQ